MSIKKSNKEYMENALNDLCNSLAKFIIRYETQLDLSNIDYQGKNCRLEPEDFEYLESLHVTSKCKELLYQILQEWFDEEDYKEKLKKIKYTHKTLMDMLTDEED